MTALLALPIVCRILLNDVLLTLAVKSSVRDRATTTILLWQYVFGFALACLCFPSSFPSLSMCLGIFVTGVAGAFALYAMWKIISRSVGVSSLCGPLPAVVAIALGFVFLDEAQHVGNYTLLVLGLCIAFFAVISLGKTRNVKGAVNIVSLLPLVLFTGVIRGGVGFALRYYKDVPTISYVFLGYFGALVGAIILFSFGGKTARGGSLSIKDKQMLLLLSFLYVLNLWVNKWLHCVAPLSLAQPILLVSGTLVPLLIGAFLYDDKAMLGKASIVKMLLAVLGMLMIVFSIN